MQTENQDRRAPHVRRIGLETRVEICGKEGDLPPFEAESIEVSGRGMQVRTRYLPEVGTPLVLRFESDGKEVLVEGAVAWRQGDDAGGQFGIKFTALDSKSVTALKALCTAGPKAPGKPAARNDDAREVDEPETLDEPYLSEKGAPVKLHIEGLGAPMKARVCRGTPRKLEVGSQLEFLKLGRSLQLEDVSAGGKRAAHIHSVDVAIEPETQIPQLVVSLRYEGVEDETPEPTVVDHVGDDEYDDEYDDDFEEDEVSEDLFKGKVGTIAASAGHAMKETSAQVAKWGTEAVGGLGALMRSAKATKKTKTKPLRRTSRVPHAPAAASAKRRSSRLEPGSRAGNSSRGRSKAPPPPPPLWQRPKMWLYGGAIALSASGVYALVGAGNSEQLEEPSAAFAEAIETPAVVPAAAGAPIPQAPAAGAVVQPGVAAQAEQPALAAQPLPPTTPSGFPVRATLSVQEQRKPNEDGIVAQVPLFGPKQMATTEPAPLNPAPMAQVDEYSLAKDQAFTDEVVSSPSADAEPDSAEGESAQSFQVGRMVLPIKHRLRLDGPGTALQGTKTPSGFTVLVPGRKVMENGSGISSRDDRIVDVRVSNTPAGGKVTFRFRKDIPGYKARLRNDFIEFFINSPKKD